METWELHDMLGAIARGHGLRWAREPLATLVLDRSDPLGAAIAQMVCRLRLGHLRPLGGVGPSLGKGPRIVVGAAALADVRLVVAGLDEADQGLKALGESGETPGANELRRALGGAGGAVAVVVANGVRSVRRLANERSEEPPGHALWGDREAVSRLVHEHGGFVRRTIARFGVGVRDVEDVAQEVLCAAGRGLPLFDPSLSAGPEGAVRGWLFGICSRQAANHHRKRLRRSEDLRDSDELDRWPHGSPGVEERWIAEERSVLLWRLVDELPPARRAVVVAYDLEEIPMAEVASVLGIPLNTAWNRLRLGRSDLRAAWRRAEAGER